MMGMKLILSHLESWLNRCVDTMAYKTFTCIYLAFIVQSWNLFSFCFCWSQAKSFRPADDSDDDDSDDDYSDDEELQSPIDDVDPFIFFVDTIKGKPIYLISIIAIIIVVV